MAGGVDLEGGSRGRTMWWGGSGLPRDRERMRFIDQEEIEAQRTLKGGWTRETLGEWGVPWPPPSGWKRAILEGGIPYQGPESTPRTRAPRSKALTAQVLAEFAPDEADRVVALWREISGLKLDPKRVKEHLEDLRKWQAEWQRRGHGASGSQSGFRE